VLGKYHVMHEMKLQRKDENTTQLRLRIKKQYAKEPDQKVLNTSWQNTDVTYERFESTEEDKSMTHN
jgi:hypothetical protein